MLELCATDFSQASILRVGFDPNRFFSYIRDQNDQK